LLRKETPDLLVLCAGAPPVLGPLQEQTWDGFLTNINVDTKATFVWLGQALRLPMKRGAHVVVVSSGAAIGGSPVSGGYAPAKRAQWLLADYARNESGRAGLDVTVHCVLPNLNASTELGRAGIRAYAARSGVTEEEFVKRFEPQLTPAIMGESVAVLFEEPRAFRNSRTGWAARDWRKCRKRGATRELRGRQKNVKWKPPSSEPTEGA